MMKSMRMMRIGLLVVLCLTALGGCQYKFGTLIPAGVHTVNVHVASNQTFWRHAERTIR